MAYDSYVQYNGDGAETDFAVTFNYLSQTVVLPPSTPAGIKVYVSDVQQTSGYTLTGSNIVFDTPPASGTNNVVIKRVTPRGHGDRLVNFAEGATLSAADLETAQLQNLYIAQEAWEQGSEDSVVTTSTTSIDPNSITATELDADCVGASELADNSVALANMTDNSVSTAEIVDASITFAKLKETTFVAGSFAAATDTFLRFNRSNGNIVDPLSEDSQVKSADISDFHAAVKTNRLDQMAAPTEAVDLSDEKITNLATPEAATDAATKGYVDSANPTMKYATFTASAATEVEIGTSEDVPKQILTGTIPTDATFITSVSWSIDVTGLDYATDGTTNDDWAIDAYLHFGPFDVSDLLPDASNILMGYWASQAGNQWINEDVQGNADVAFPGNTRTNAGTPDMLRNIAWGINVATGDTPAMGSGSYATSEPYDINSPNSRTIPMFQPYSESLTPSITAYFNEVYGSTIPATDATVTITHETTVAVTYITA